MKARLIIALGFSLGYFLELLLFGIGAFKEGGGRGLGYCFLAVLLLLWAGLYATRRIKYRTSVFCALGMALFFWVIPGWRVELAMERRDDEETIDKLRRIEVSDVNDEPLLNAQGKAAGILMRYSIRFPADGTYDPAPILTPADNRFLGRSMRVVRSEITPPPEKKKADSLNTGIQGHYRSGVMYRFTVELLPGFVIATPGGDKTCLNFSSESEKSAVTSSDVAISFQVHIDGTDYGGYFGGPPQQTRNTYRVRDLYENAVASGAKSACVFGPHGEVQ